MPELPEVETVIRQIRPFVQDQRIKRLHVQPSGERLILPYSTSQLQHIISQQVINDLTRHGKYMRFHLDQGGEIVAHLRMTGRFSVSTEPLSHPHLRLSLEFEDGSFLNFIDIRRFATFVYEPDSKLAQKLGPDALEAARHVESIYQVLSNKNRPIYSALMDQSILAGIGNIYANEILFASQIHPLMPSRSLNIKQVRVILRETERILQQAIVYNGTTLVDKTYKDIFEDYGEFALHLQVYGRAGQLCKRCGEGIIDKIRVSGRSVYLCPVCQSK